MNDEGKRPKYGAGHADAMKALGMRELRELGWFQDSNVAQPSEMGLYGTRTPSEVTQGRMRDVYGHEAEEQLGWPKESQQQREPSMEHEQEQEQERGD